MRDKKINKLLAESKDKTLKERSIEILVYLLGTSRGKQKTLIIGYCQK